MNFLGFFAFSVVSTFGMWLFEGYTITMYWSWFITPTFEIKTPALWVCVGLSMMITLLTNHTWNKEFKEQMEKDEKFEESVKSSVIVVLISFFRVFIFLSCGWVVHCIAG